ncbi:hypothetical protein SAMN05421805_1184 [Saccharopolyspora antimicrobica]|uniref:Uncharacterized protein n=1 Tax=Saccharopolyspora antimicrobica TaxID=455193 RepID=A0A1I5IAT5_9PSEU|nr:hypothetical protein ATL45_3942 [Saccharopolyspora antimicrobica]SFO57101.1 hypothetical protein SAMN05421805_1184 [Saccharopolyspora antimicrobica]
MTIPHVPSNPERIARAAEQNLLIDQCNNTTNAVAEHTSTLSDHGARLLSLESGPPPHTHPISEVTGLRAELDDHDARLSTLETAPAPVLDDLADVTATGATDGQVLKFSAGTWAPADDATGTGGGATTLDQLDDVTTAGAAAGHVLKFNGSTWAPGTDNTSSGGTGATVLDELTDVSTIGATDGQALVYSAGTWSPSAPTPAAHVHAVADVSGLQAALHGKADDAEITALDGRIGNLENAASALYPTTASDTLLYGDVISSHQRSDCQWGESLTNNYMTAVATRSPKDFTATELRLCVTAAAVGSGTFDLKVYTGPSLSALAERHWAYGQDKVNTAGVKHIPIGDLAIAEGDHIAICMIATGWTTSPRLSSTPTGSGAQLLIGERPYSVYQAGQTFPPPAVLNTTESKWTRANQLFWFAFA